MPGLDVDKQKRELANQGWRVFILPTGIKDRKSFFNGVRTVLPLDPPIVSDRSWDALSDSLWEGLHNLDSDKIAIIWPGAEEMANAQKEDFEIAASVLSDVSELLVDVEATVGDPQKVLVLLA
jgi:hypothetical protein